MRRHDPATVWQLSFVPIGEPFPPVALRVRRLLKAALGCRLRCIRCHPEEQAPVEEDVGMLYAERLELLSDAELALETRNQYVVWLGLTLQERDRPGHPVDMCHAELLTRKQPEVWVQCQAEARAEVLARRSGKQA